GVNGDRAADTEAKRWEYTWWWLRSPDSVYEDYVKACEGWRLRTHDGQEDGGGIVPALFINLPRGR
ncbi:MAG: hypothetical protein J6X72_03375, partial [Clostridia bacterium]|nr:hypothetical protein [Clostridia bacterium]